MITTRHCALVLVGLALVWGGYQLARSLLGPKQGMDFAQYYVAGRLVLDGEPQAIYDTGPLYQERAERYGVPRIVLDGEAADVMTYAYPPLLAYALLPFCLLPYAAARYAFFAASLLAAFAAIPPLFSSRPIARRRAMTRAGWLATFLFFPTYYALYMGQVNALALWACAGALHFLRRERAWAAGFLVALASLVKLFPLVLLLLFLLKRQWRLLGTTLACLAALVGATALAGGLELQTTFLTRILPAQWSGGAWVRNQGLTGLLSRLLTENEHVRPLVHAPGLARGLGLIASAALLFCVLRFTRRDARPGTLAYDAEYGWFFTLALLLLAKSWEHYAVFLLPSYLFLFETLVDEPGGDGAPLLALALSYAVWAFVLTAGVEYEQLPKAAVANLAVSAKCLATLLLFACHLWAVDRGRPREG